MLEAEADHFAASMLMPAAMFRTAMRGAGEGFAAIEALQVTFSTAHGHGVRYATLCDDPVVSVMSEGARSCYAFASASILDIRGLRLPRKGSRLPRDCETRRFNADPENVRSSRRAIAYSRLEDWLDKAPELDVKEDVFGLGGYGRPLTVLFAEQMPDLDEDDCS